MNIFLLHENLKTCAEWHVDKHVVKMPIEAMQIASTAIYALGMAEYCEVQLYRPTHIRHPLVKWAGQDLGRVSYVCSYGLAVAEEYNYRYNRTHATTYPLLNLINWLHIDPHITPTFSEMPWCMPDEFHQKTIHDSYRNYYAIAKAHLHRWTKRDVPYWISPRPPT